MKTNTSQLRNILNITIRPKHLSTPCQPLPWTLLQRSMPTSPERFSRSILLTNYYTIQGFCLNFLGFHQIEKEKVLNYDRIYDYLRIGGVDPFIPGTYKNTSENYNLNNTKATLTFQSKPKKEKNEIDKNNKISSFKLSIFHFFLKKNPFIYVMKLNGVLRNIK